MSGSTQDSSSLNLKPPLIFLIDDDLNLVIALKRYLLENKFDVCTATSFQEGQMLLRNLAPDLFIVDILLKEDQKTGYDFVLWLKAQSEFCNSPWIFLSAKGLTQDRIKGYTLGCAAYVTKPFDPEELVSVIKGIMNQSKHQDVHMVNQSHNRIRNIRLELKNKLVHQKNLFPRTLTPRERLVLKDLLEGYSTREIARKTNTSIRNIEKYITRLLAKTNTKNQNELISFISALMSIRANDGNRTRE